MSTHRAAPIDGDTAERILDNPRHPAVRDHPVAAVVADAAAPTGPGMVAGRQVALAAFRAAGLAPVPEQRRKSMLKIMLAKLLTAKIAIGAATAVAASGVALAAGAGTIPNPLDGAAGSQASAAADGSSHAQRGARSTSPNLVGLCQAYTNDAGDNPGKALDSPAFTSLITAAGGKDKVADYCEDLLADPPRGAAPTDHPTGAPTGAPGDRPTGAPADRPTNAPSERPTSGPSDKATRVPSHPTATATARR